MAFIFFPVKFYTNRNICEESSRSDPDTGTNTDTNISEHLCFTCIIAYIIHHTKRNTPLATKYIADQTIPILMKVSNKSKTITNQHNLAEPRPENQIYDITSSPTLANGVTV